MQTREMSLRQRNRRRTRASIASAAVRLTLELGIDAATIEAISAEANVSPRTFFNYFDSKDDALLGEFDARELDALVAGVVSTAEHMSEREIAVRLFVERVRPMVASDSARAARFELLSRYPHLFAVGFRLMNEAQDAFSAAVRGIAEERHGPDDSAMAWVDVLVAAAGGAVRRAFKEATTEAGTRSVEDIEARANAILTIAWEKLQ